MFYVAIIVNKNGEVIRQMSGLKAMIEMYLMQNMKSNQTAYLAKEEDYKVIKHYKIKKGSFVLEEIPLTEELYLANPHDDVNTWFNKTTDLVLDALKLNIAINVEEILNIYYDNEEQEKVSKDELVDWTLTNMKNEYWYDGSCGGWVENWEDNPLSQTPVEEIKKLILYYIDNYSDTKIALCE